MNFLDRETILDIVEHMTARDIFAAMPQGKTDAQGQPIDPSGTDIAGKAFEHAAERQGHGAEALDRVRPHEATYLAGLLSEVFTAEAPKGDSTEPSPDSSDIGDSPLS